MASVACLRWRFSSCLPSRSCRCRGQDLVVNCWVKMAAERLAVKHYGIGGHCWVIEMSQGWLHVSSGIAERWKNWGIVSFIARVVALLAGLPFGPDGLAIALVVVGWLIAFPSVSYAGHPLGIGAALAIKTVGGLLLRAASG